MMMMRTSRIRATHSRCAPLCFRTQRRSFPRLAFLPSPPPPPPPRQRQRQRQRQRHRALCFALLVPAVAFPVFVLSPEFPSDSSSRQSDSSSNYATAAVLAFLTSVTSAFTLWASDDSDSQKSTPDPTPPPSHTMTIPPGRPSNLTAEQEAKLKEFWLASLKVFGVLSTSSEGTESESIDVSTPASDADSTSAAGSEVTKEKKKKSLGRLLSRRDKKTGEKGKEAEISVSSSAIDEQNDKYGQTKEFKDALATQTPKELRDTFWSMVKCDDPDGLLLRFLRARKWDVDKALVMMVSTMNWRSKVKDVQGVIEWGEGGALKDKNEEFLNQLRWGKGFLHGTDKEGRPISYVRVRLHKAADQNEETLEKFTIYTMETARLMLSPEADTACVVFDMTDFGLQNMDYAPLKFMIKCFEAHYPESLGVCLIHKAPWVFQGIWNVIKGWLDPVVAGKINFTRTTDELAGFIARSQIPKEMGGDEEWSYTYTEPSATENDAMKDKATLAKVLEAREELYARHEELTKNWIEGVEDETKVKKDRGEISERLASGYWEMDRYIRARTLYDRIGVIGEGGRIDHEAWRKGKGKAAVETSEDDID